MVSDLQLTGMSLGDVLKALCVALPAAGALLWLRLRRPSKPLALGLLADAPSRDGRADRAPATSRP